ncbi:unnamed protein product [Withania somnifera]
MAYPDVEEEAQLEKPKKWERRRDSRSLCDPPLFLIRDYPFHKSSGDFTVFPPVNHENLYISVNSVQKTHSRSSSPPFPSSPSSLSLSSSSFSPSHRDNDDSSYSFAASDSNLVDPPQSVTARAACYRGSWWNLGLQVLISRVSGIAILRQGFSSARRAVEIILSPFGMAVMLMMLAYFRRRWRLNRGQSAEELRCIIRAKDERINQLLSQIAEMNQVFVAMHKRNLSKN